MKKILNLVLAYLLIFNSVFASTITNNLDVGGDSSVSGSSFISKILSIAGSFVTPDSKVDGSFENGTSQWTISSGSSLTATTTDFSDGTKSGILSLASNGTADLCTDMTKLNGRDIESSAEFKNSSTGLQICTLKNSVEATCNAITPDSYWKNWASISKAQSSGQHCLRIKNPTAGTLTALIDSGKIGKFDEKNVQVVEQESVSYTGYSSGTNPVVFKTKDTLRSNEKNLIEVTTVGSAGTVSRYTILKPSNVVVGAGGDYTNGGIGVIHYNSAGSIIKSSYNNTLSDVANSTLSTSANAGDYFIAQSSGSPNDNTYAFFSITATAISDHVERTWEPSDRIGETIYLPSNVAPRGFIPAMGSSIGKTTGTYQGDTYYNLYKALWPISLNTAGQPYYLSGAKGSDALADWNAGKTLTIDESGLFTRASGGNAGAVGAKQMDAFQGHKHDTLVNGVNSYGQGTVTRTGVNGASTNSTLGAMTSSPDYGDGNGTPRTSNETRPINVAKYIFIRYATSEPVVLALPSAKQTEYVLEVNSNSAQSVNNTTAIPFLNVDTNKNMNWNGSSFVTPISGMYKISSSIVTSNTGTWGLAVYVNGSNKKSFPYAAQASAAQTLSGEVYLQVGDVVDIRQNSTLTIMNLQVSTTNHWLSVTRLNGKNESVAVGDVAKDFDIYVRAKGLSTTNATQGASVPLTFTSIVNDTNSAFNGRYFIAPYSGYYTLSGTIAFIGSSIGNKVISLFIDDVFENDISGFNNSVAGVQYRQPFSRTVYLNKNQKIDLRIYNDGLTFLLDQSGIQSSLTIYAKVPQVN